MTGWTPEDTPEEAALRSEYMQLLHAMQSGVATEMEDASRASATSPKHLRVGVNAALTDHYALAKLLMEKGVITKLEYYRALRDAMAEEVERYETRLSAAHGGASVKLY